MSTEQFKSSWVGYAFISYETNNDTDNLVYLSKITSQVFVQVNEAWSGNQPKTAKLRWYAYFLATGTYI